MITFSELSPKKRAFLTGTILLTCTGLACRVLGFFYRIFLSRTIGAEGLGIYNMVHPIFGICFALCAGSIQTALSQHIASHIARGRSIFRTGIVISMTMSFVLAYLICRHADFLATAVLMEPRCALYLPLIGISVPFAAFHACINGYYYGMQKSHVPAFSQVVEQIIRMAAVFLVASSWLRSGRTITVMLAAYGHLIGEAASAAFTFLCLLLFPPQAEKPATGFFASGTAAPLMALALPLMGNRLVLNLLSSAEAIWIPSRLQMSGLKPSEAFSIYGVLTGMALPFILFPSAITNSLAVLLLPSVAKDQAEGRKGSIAASISLSLRYSLYMGILCIGIFTLFGEELGYGVFCDPDAGRFIRILAWLCPFLYLATTMGSILNGLGQTRTTFLQNTACLLLRIAFVLFGIPWFGILAYLWGMLASELLLALLHLFSLKKRIAFAWNAWDMVIKPAALLLIAIGIHYFTLGLFPSPGKLPLFVETAIQILFLCFCYGGLLLVFHFARRGRDQLARCLKHSIEKSR
ncbi:polysaccharide biosynthesis protein [Clostridiaceae bacterium]|nr:polysaccharide biosynthesis protein [Clostridiaceae bacterium]RKI18369.1 polysaccharide biosynthesis protein [bacterium 1XD21-70]